MPNRIRFKRLVLQAFLLLISFFAAVLINKFITADLFLRFISHSSPTMFLLILFVQNLIIYLLLRQILNRKMDKISIRMLWGCYFGVLFIVLFLRGVRYRTFGLHPFSFIQDLSVDPNAFLLLIMNILFFIPIGYLLRKRRPLVSLPLFLLLDLSIEAAQYIFSRGSFDLGDITLNTLGFCIGYFYFRHKTPLDVSVAK